ncbi:MAG: hypothetical protein K6G38_00630 [Gammaproteobacteria bacterium]|nr:hypothetical protein [Gammaproteobacteria bacterium]
MSFSSSNVWNFLIVVGILFLGMMIAYLLKNNIKFLKKSLVPVSVIAGLIILIFTTIYKVITGETFFDLAFLSVTNGEDTITTGSSILETITYHALGIGFVSMAFRKTKKSDGKSTLRGRDILNTGVTTVSTYLLQAVFGLIITIIFSLILTNTSLIPASGALLCLGFGQGTGQALNFGTVYENEYGFIGGAHFGLALAALGFLSASIGGVIYLNILRRKGKIQEGIKVEEIKIEDYEEKNEVGLTESIDKFSIQIALVLIAYVLAYLLMAGISALIPSMKATIFGFNFLFGTLIAVLIKAIMNFLRKKNIIKRQYINNFLMNRLGGVAFDVMIVSGIAVIDLELIIDYWYILLILMVAGALSTFFYIRLVSKTLYKDYRYEQFFGMYGMLTGTASTGIILLREIDPNLETPASSNMVYQNFPAIVLGLPIMLLVPYAAHGLKEALIVLAIAFAYFVVLVLFLFRSVIFKRKVKVEEAKKE